MVNDPQDTEPISGSAEADPILDAALELATERDNWYDLSLISLAQHCGVPVNRIRRHYADSNAIANAWFARALDSMLAVDLEELAPLPVRERLEVIIWRWFESLGPYHRVSVQMLGAKLHPPHMHHWMPMVFDLSRLVQFWREAAGLHDGGRRRQIEEVVLTGIFLATLRSWCRDDSSHQTQAHARLQALLGAAERAASFCFSAESR